MSHDITTHILREIRDELRALRTEVRGTNERLDATNDRMDAMNVALNERMDATDLRIDSLSQEMRAGFAAVLHVIPECDRATDARRLRLEEHAGLPR